MTILDWLYKRTFFWLCIIYNLSSGIDGHHNDTCQSADGRQAICVANRYCRERFQHHLLPCADNKICCPIPTTPSPPSPSQERVRRPNDSERPKNYPQPDGRTDDSSPRKPINPQGEPVEELPSTRLDENKRPRYRPDVDDRQYEDSRRQRRPVEKELPKYDIDDRPPDIKEDERRRRPGISYGKPEYDIPFREPERSRRPQEYGGDDDLLPSLSEGGHSRNPIRTYDEPVKDTPSRRPGENGRPRYKEEDDPPRRSISSSRNPSKDIPLRIPDRNERRRQNRPTYESIDDDRERPRKPIDVYDEPEIDTPPRAHSQPPKPVGRPRYDDHSESLPKKPGKVRFEDEYSVERGGRPSKPRERGRPAGPIYIDDGDYDSRSDYLPMPRRDSSSSSNHRYDTEDSRPRPDNYDRRRQTDEVPSLYPSKDQIDDHRDPPRRSSIDSPKSKHEFPEHPGFSMASQPKVPECGVKPYELFIAGGETSEPHEWPWMTAIFRRHQNSRPKTFICGGSLINTKYILTAAHCFVHNYKILPASTFVVRVGSHQLNSGEEYTVSEVIVHRNHSGSDFFNDIALIKLASDVYVTDKVAPICLPSMDMAGEDFVGRMATVAGWGDTAFRTGGSRTLQHVTIPVVSGEECFAAYSRVKGAAFLARGSDHVICAGLREGGKDACLGDSGGPLMLKATEDRWIIVGVVSLGYKCAEPGYPGVYTRVTHYIPWIQSNMKQH